MNTEIGQASSVVNPFLGLLDNASRVAAHERLVRHVPGTIFRPLDRPRLVLAQTCPEDDVIDDDSVELVFDADDVVIDFGPETRWG